MYKIRTTGTTVNKFVCFLENFIHYNLYRQIHKNFYHGIVEPFFRNLVLNSIFHGLKLASADFRREMVRQFDRKIESRV